MPFSTRHRYGAIYADPPWSFRNWSAKGTGRNAVSHYDCLNFETLAALPVADLAADDCALFLWAVDPLLDKAFELIRAWGFEYKTVGFYWVKQNNKSDGFFTGLGYCIGHDGKRWFEEFRLYHRKDGRVQMVNQYPQDIRRWILTKGGSRSERETGKCSGASNGAAVGVRRDVSADVG
jgi:hypothetical protein